MFWGIFLVYIAVISVITFTVCGADKLKAKKGARRVPEKTLFLLSAIGGSIGMLCGMYLFRHKTKHKSFTIGISIMLILQIVIILLADRFIF